MDVYVNSLIITHTPLTIMVSSIQCSVTTAATLQRVVSKNSTWKYILRYTYFERKLVIHNIQGPAVRSIVDMVDHYKEDVALITDFKCLRFGYV